MENYLTLKAISERITQRRGLLGITQQTLSDLSGVSLRTVKVVEKGDKPYSIANLIQIADALGLEINLFAKKLSM